MTLPVLPSKPRKGDPCNGCGHCCQNELCDIAERVFHQGGIIGRRIGGMNRPGPCPALEYTDGRSVCGIYANPQRHMPALAADNVDAVRRLVVWSLGFGNGCDMDDWWNPCEDFAMKEATCTE